MDSEHNVNSQASTRKKRGATSKANERFERIENFLGLPPPGEELDGDLVGFNMFGALQSIGQALQHLKTEILNKNNVGDTTQDGETDPNEGQSDETHALRTEIAALRAQLQRERSRDNVNNAPPSVKVPEPKYFDGTRDSKALENFLWDLEQYFRAARIHGRDKVLVASMYLVDDAKHWWRTQTDETLNGNLTTIESWDEFKTQLRAQFLPNNASWLAREALKDLKQNGSVRDYVKSFSSLMLDIKNMSEEDKLFNFMKGLKPWAQLELMRQRVDNLSMAVSSAESLIEFKPIGPTDGKNGKSKEKNENHKGKNGNNGKRTDSSSPNKEGSPTKKARTSGCFICGGPHLMRDCEKKEKLSALMAQEKEIEAQLEEPYEHLNTLRLTDGDKKDDVEAEASWFESKYGNK